MTTYYEVAKAMVLGGGWIPVCFVGMCIVVRRCESRRGRWTA